MILNTGSKPQPIQAACQTIFKRGFDRKAVQAAMNEFCVADITYCKSDILSLLLTYANIILDDHVLSESEDKDFGLLKLHLKIKEWEFYANQLHQIKGIINEQMEHIGSDGRIDLDESFTIANLQSMFDLNVEQFFALWDNPSPSINVSKSPTDA